MEIYKKLTWSPAIREDIKRENANIDGDTAMGTMLKYGSEGSKFFIDNYILPKDASAAHINGDIHIHDKDFYMLTETCCQIDLIRLFANGFSTGHGFLREPNSIESYSALACIAIQANQNEMHGGQSVPHFDFAMAGGVVKTWAREYRKALTAFLRISGVLGRSDAEALVTRLLAQVTVPVRMAESTALGEAIAADAPDELREAVARAHAYAVEEALENTDRRVYQSMEALIHNLNTMNSRAGAQVPFSSINYGTDTSAEGRMVVKNLLLATQAGLGNGETSIFPVQIFKVSIIMPVSPTMIFSSWPWQPRPGGFSPISVLLMRPSIFSTTKRATMTVKWPIWGAVPVCWAMCMTPGGRSHAAAVI